ncbi:hypothetical protein KIPB_010934, partial [Kipferlia bialata]|eukprot:g10934.t1
MTIAYDEEALVRERERERDRARGRVSDYRSREREREKDPGDDATAALQDRAVRRHQRERERQQREKERERERVYAYAPDQRRARSSVRLRGDALTVHVGTVNTKNARPSDSTYIAPKPRTVYRHVAVTDALVEGGEELHPGVRLYRVEREGEGERETHSDGEKEKPRHRRSRPHGERETSTTERRRHTAATGPEALSSTVHQFNVPPHGTRQRQAMFATLGFSALIGFDKRIRHLCKREGKPDAPGVAALCGKTYE